MTRALGPILKTILFTIFVPGTVTVLVPAWLLGGFPRPERGPLTWVGVLIMLLGAAIYFRCAWEFAVRGLGTPAPIAPTKFLVVTALHRYVRNPMYIGVFGVLLGEAVAFRSAVLLGTQHASACRLNCLSCTTRSPHCAASSASRMKNTGAPSRAGSQGTQSRTSEFLAARNMCQFAGSDRQVSSSARQTAEAGRPHMGHSPMRPRSTVMDAFGSW